MNDTTSKDRIIVTVTRLFINTDNRDWPRVRILFAPRVLLDRLSVTALPDILCRMVNDARIFVSNYDMHRVKMGRMENCVSNSI